MSLYIYNKTYSKEIHPGASPFPSEGDLGDAWVPMPLSSKDGLPKTAVMARKRPFMTAVVIVNHFKDFSNFACLPIQAGYKVYDYYRVIERRLLGMCR